jgi:hypothetical protein
MRESANGSTVWIGASDGYVGQMCVLNMVPEPDVQCCNGVNNSRITCICAVPSPKYACSSRVIVSYKTSCRPVVVKRRTRLAVITSSTNTSISESTCTERVHSKPNSVANLDLNSDDSSDHDSSADESEKIGRRLRVKCGHTANLQ